ncbi:MAG: TIR domain-containing protein [Luteitalea sp.]|nr:TIR domain-containing protein [Luteitalea sp.]
MTVSPGARDVGLRRLAQLSILLAVASLLATAGALILLSNAAAAGQWIVIAGGASVSASAFAFGVMISLRKTRARQTGFVVVAIAFLTAGLFALLAYVVPEAAWIFGAWTIGLLAYAALATHRLVRWPTGGVWDQPQSRLALFISYRRQDSRETVGRIHDHLRQAFEEKHLFLDADSQTAGEDYRIVIGRALERADVVLAVIGTRWLTVTDREDRRRLDDAEDMVRIELETALERNLLVIPVLIEGASMPGPAEVPPSIRPLCYRTAVPVRPDPDFKNDIERLVVTLRVSQEHQPGGAAIKV